jgi:hypothetical protein
VGDWFEKDGLVGGLNLKEDTEFYQQLQAAES